MDGSREYYAKGNESDRERQILHDLTYMWNLKSKTNKQKKPIWKQAHRSREQMWLPKVTAVGVGGGNWWRGLRV